MGSRLLSVFFPDMCRSIFLATLFTSWFETTLAAANDKNGDFMVGAAAKLEHYLLSNYSTIARPVRYGHESVSVNFDFILNQILEVVSLFHHGIFGHFQSYLSKHHQIIFASMLIVLHASRASRCGLARKFSVKNVDTWTLFIQTSRERPKSAPYLRLKNNKRTSKCQVLPSTVPV